MPIVRNVKYALKRDHNVYIGSGDEYRKRSPLAVPYNIRLTNYKDDAARQQMLENYRHWLWAEMQKTPEAPVWTELRKINPESVLLCHCHPKPCHGHVIVKAWTWAYQNGHIEPVWRNHTSDKTIKAIGRANAKELAPPHTAVGPLDMKATVERLAQQPYRDPLADARLDEEILETCTTHDFCQEPSNALHASLPPKKKQGRGAPRKPRGICYVQPDVRYNLLDDIAADLDELYTTTAA